MTRKAANVLKQGKKASGSSVGFLQIGNKGVRDQPYVEKKHLSLTISDNL
jgi:hypothetical protein